MVFVHCGPPLMRPKPRLPRLFSIHSLFFHKMLPSLGQWDQPLKLLHFEVQHMKMCGWTDSNFNSVIVFQTCTCSLFVAVALVAERFALFTHKLPTTLPAWLPSGAEQVAYSEIFSLLFLKNSLGHSEITWELPNHQSRHFHLLGTDWTSNDCVGAVGCAWLISSVLLLTYNSGWLHFINLFQVNCPSSIGNQTTTFTFCHRV